MCRVTEQCDLLPYLFCIGFNRIKILNELEKALPHNFFSQMSFTVILVASTRCNSFTVYYTVDILVSLAGTVKVLIDKISKSTGLLIHLLNKT